ncbi:hypothetical protein BJX64DRAFT_223933 [Aspergillus heterothallicus]
MEILDGDEPLEAEPCGKPQPCDWRGCAKRLMSFIWQIRPIAPSDSAVPGRLVCFFFFSLLTASFLLNRAQRDRCARAIIATLASFSLILAQRLSSRVAGVPGPKARRCVASGASVCMYVGVGPSKQTCVPSNVSSTAVKTNYSSK